MNRRVVRTALAAVAAALMLIPAQPARSDDLESVRSAMKTASAALHSFRIEVAVSMMGMSISTVTTIVREPARLHMVTTGPMSMEMYVVDGFLYTHLGSTAWQKREMPPHGAQLDMVRALTDAVHMTVGPDVTEDGVTYGELLVVTDAGMLPGTTTPSMNQTCRYEKKTFLMHDCKTDIFTERFTGYDDPANVIVLPADAAAAVDGGPVPLPLPLPSAPPATAPTTAPN